MPSGLTRQASIESRARAAPAPVRPPWARPAGPFEDMCSRGGACVDACPEHIVVRGDGGFPVVDFALGGCTFCGACVDTCASGALHFTARPPWILTLSVGEGCVAREGVACRACADWCDAAALRLPPAGRRGPPAIDLARCTRCGGCVAPCPADAVSLTASKPGGRT